MQPILVLGIAIGCLSFPLGFAIGFNVAGGTDFKEFKKSKYHLICRSIE